MKHSFAVLTTCFAISLSACDSDSNDINLDQPHSIDFQQAEHQFTPIFSDYPVSTDEQNNEAFYQLEGNYIKSPTDDTLTPGWRLSGDNRSDDLLMAIKGYVRGLKANRHYQFTLSVSLSTDIPANCVGIGGAPGESVFVKLAASAEEPKNEKVDGMYRLNIDLGNQSQSGTQGVTVGDISNGIDCNDEQKYVKKTLSMQHAIDVKTDRFGGFWLLAGTDSGFEGTTTYYINKITMNIAK